MNNVVLESDIQIENMIYEIRGKQVMLASDVARLYNSETKIINQVVKRNINRFPENFCFQLTMIEYLILRSQFVTSSQNDILDNQNLYVHGGNRYLPYVFTEHGIMMLSGLLRSDVAVKVNIQIIDAFVKMRKYISSDLINKSYLAEQVLENTKNIKLLQESFDKFKENKVINEIYFDGQIYDAYSKILDIFNDAKNKLIIIDSYSDKNTLDIIKKLNIDVVIITSFKSNLKDIDIDKYNSQYGNLKVIYNDSFHDRYFILDKSIVYHCGTSLNYIGKKTFSINKIEDDFVIESLIEKVDIILIN